MGQVSTFLSIPLCYSQEELAEAATITRSSPSKGRKMERGEGEGGRGLLAVWMPKSVGCKRQALLCQQGVGEEEDSLQVPLRHQGAGGRRGQAPCLSCLISGQKHHYKIDFLHTA